MKKPAYRTIRIHYDDGHADEFKTTENVPECIEHYLPAAALTDSTRREVVPVTARCVEFLDRNVYRDSHGNVHSLRRVYLLSDKLMSRYDLFCRYRFTERVYTPSEWRFGPVGKAGRKRDSGLPDCILSGEMGYYPFEAAR